MNYMKRMFKKLNELDMQYSEGMISNAEALNGITLVVLETREAAKKAMQEETDRIKEEQRLLNLY